MFLEAERAHCRALYDAEDDLARRLVLADALLERGEPLGELLRLAVEAHPDAEAKTRALLPRLVAELYPGATALALDRGLPFAASFEAARLLQRGDGQPPVWPLRWATLSGEPGPVFAALCLPLLGDVERLDLSGCSFESPYSMFVGDAPPPVPRLRRLRQLLAPRSPPPAHWAPLVRDTFAQATTLSVPVDTEDLSSWLDLVPATRRLNLALARVPLDGARRAEALAWAAGAPDRELAINGIVVRPPELDALLTALGPALPGVALSEVADPPVGKLASLEVHGPLAPGSDLHDATLDGQRGTWVRLAGDHSDFSGRVRVQQDLRLLMMAPLHRHIAGGKTARRGDDETWVLLGEGLRPLQRPADRAGALDAAGQLGEALGALAGYVAQHAPRVSFPWPLPASDLLVDARGSLRVVPPRQSTPVPPGGVVSLGFPTRSSTWSLAVFTAAVLVEWLSGRALAPVRAQALRVDDDWGEWERLSRFLEAPRLPPEVPADVAAVVSRAFGDRHHERLTLEALVSALVALPR